MSPNDLRIAEGARLWLRQKPVGSLGCAVPGRLEVVNDGSPATLAGVAESSCVRFDKKSIPPDESRKGFVDEACKNSIPHDRSQNGSIVKLVN